MTPVIGKPRREYAEVFIPRGAARGWRAARDCARQRQSLADTRSGVGQRPCRSRQPRARLLVFDLGTGSLANYASLKLPVNKLNKVFITHLHADHMGDLITLSGSFSKIGRADGPVSCGAPAGPNLAWARDTSSSR